MRGIDGGAAAFAINAASEDPYAGVEANLDFGAAIPLVYPQETVLFMTDDYEQEGDYLDGFLQNMFNAIDGSYCRLDAFNITGNSPGIDAMYPDPTPIYGYNHSLMCGAYRPTNVISASYSLTELNYPTAYLQRQCAEIMKLALQGVSFPTLYCGLMEGRADVKLQWRRVSDQRCFCSRVPFQLPVHAFRYMVFVMPLHSVFMLILLITALQSEQPTFHPLRTFSSPSRKTLRQPPPNLVVGAASPTSCTSTAPRITFPQLFQSQSSTTSWPTNLTSKPC